ncbi:hypothetical protein [Phyllobacterium zundukense]|uniref:Uncharacterized protein n=1 Tax=Phyllobacterium zundukense TaxID=1867719 RepID=A0ACD4D6T4_9HYPH|nr:hypothetical protein [Phyllobacterium zundukense]UXN61560.1 hypothetical protein N8E88_15995 [Phyllobacterium zundukense]
MAKKSEIAGPSDQKKDRLEKYSHVVGVAQLRAVQVTSVEFNVKPEFFSDEADRSLGYVVIKGGQQFSHEDCVAMAFIGFEVAAKTGRKKTLVCKAEYAVTYDNLVDCDEEATMVFLNRVAVFACYPYFRSLFATLDWAAATSLPPLPVHKEPAVKSPAEKGRMVAKSAPRKKVDN